MLCNEYLTEALQRLYTQVSLRPPLTSAVTSFRLFRAGVNAADACAFEISIRGYIGDWRQGSAPLNGRQTEDNLLVAALYFAFV